VVAVVGLVEVEVGAAKVVARPEVAVPVDPEVGLAAVAEGITVLAWEVVEVAAATTALGATMALEEVAAATTAAPGEVDLGDPAEEVLVVSAVADRVVNLPRLVPGLPRTLRPSGSTQPSLVSSRLTEF
jgi:hypothetical protein